MISLQFQVTTKVTVRYCPDHETPIIYRPTILESIVLYKRTYCMDVLVFIGLTRWLFCFQIAEILAFLRRKSVPISYSEISNLSIEFLAYFRLVHENNYPKLKRLIELIGGAILHIDGTNESGKGVVITLKEGRTEITLMAENIPSESEEHIEPIIRKYKEKFGIPIVIIRDMGKAVTNSVAKVFPSVPNQICHFHFVKDLGEKILSNHYQTFRKMIINHKVTTQLKKIRAKLNTYTNGTVYRDNGSQKILRMELKWIHIACDHILHPLFRKSDFPFELPYIAMFERLLHLHRLTKKVITWNAEHNVYLKELMEFDSMLTAIYNCIE